MMAGMKESTRDLFSGLRRIHGMVKKDDNRLYRAEILRRIAKGKCSLGANNYRAALVTIGYLTRKLSERSGHAN